MNKFFLLLFFIITDSFSADFNIKIYYEPIENGFKIYADNLEYCPVSIRLTFTLQNMKIEGGNKKIYVIPEQKTKQLLTVIRKADKRKASKFSYKSRYNLGDHTITTYDHEFSYILPFEKSNSFKIAQGYNGAISHNKKNALDFTMPIGTKITAIRDGTVVKVVDSNSKSCKTVECKKYNNFVIVYHSDGTFAEYTHIKNKGSLVNIGDKIVKGQKLAFSGNVGFSTGPHLHLEVFLQKLEKRQTLRTKFKIESNRSAIYLSEKHEYVRNY